MTKSKKIKSVSTGARDLAVDNVWTGIIFSTCWWSSEIFISIRVSRVPLHLIGSSQHNFVDKVSDYCCLLLSFIPLTAMDQGWFITGPSRTRKKEDSANFR